MWECHENDGAMTRGPRGPIHQLDAARDTISTIACRKSQGSRKRLKEHFGGEFVRFFFCATERPRPVEVSAETTMLIYFAGENYRVSRISLKSIDHIFEISKKLSAACHPRLPTTQVLVEKGNYKVVHPFDS